LLKLVRHGLVFDEDEVIMFTVWVDWNNLDGDALGWGVGDGDGVSDSWVRLERTRTKNGDGVSGDER
jgi:hypothetical protein